MQYKEIKFDQNARTKILKGVNKVSDAVCTTLGPRGAHVIFSESVYPTITKDGVTVAQQIMLEDKFENMWAMLTREAAEKTNSEAGDGTTSTVAILRDIVNEGNKYIVAGMNPVLLKRGIDYAVGLVNTELDKITKTITTKEEKVNIAKISANNDEELGKMIVDVIDEVGKDGVVTVTTNNSFNTEVEYVTGTKLDSWFESSIFINDTKRLLTSLNNPAIIVTSDRIAQQNQLVPILQKLLEANKKNIILFADAVEGQALAFLVQNYIKGAFTCVPVRLPSFGGYQKDIMRDFSKLIWATILGEEYGKKIQEGSVEDVGTCENVTITRNSSILTGGSGDITPNIDEVKALLKDEKDTFRIEKLKERLGKLTGKIANIKVGGASQTEQSEIKYRIEDALNATKSAIEDGIVEGAGTALLRCSENLNVMTIEKMVEEDKGREFSAGIDIVRRAIQAPFKMIIQNGWENADAIMGKVLEWDMGYNSLTQKYEHLIDTGIIDPVKVVKNEITNASATAGILLTSNCAIAGIEDKKE